MTPTQLSHIRWSAGSVNENPDRFAKCFYDRLFSTAPHVRGLFPDDMTPQYGRIVVELGFLAGAANDLDRFVERAVELGRRHRGYGVDQAHFAPVEEALIHALKDHHGEEWTADLESSWAALYRLIAQIMLDGANTELFTTS